MFLNGDVPDPSVTQGDQIDNLAKEAGDDRVRR
jgi:hypothetical protein